MNMACLIGPLIFQGHQHICEQARRADALAQLIDHRVGLVLVVVLGDEVLGSVERFTGRHLHHLANHARGSVETTGEMGEASGLQAPHQLARIDVEGLGEGELTVHPRGAVRAATQRFQDFICPKGSTTQ